MTSTILVIDDDPATLNLLKMHLTRDRFVVLTAGSGAEGCGCAIRWASPSARAAVIGGPPVDCGRHVLHLTFSEPEPAILGALALLDTVLQDPAMT